MFVHEVVPKGAALTLSRYQLFTTYYTPDGCCREYTVYENSVVSKSDKIFQKGWRDENRKQVLTLATCPSRRSDINRRIVNAELTLLKR